MSVIAPEVVAFMYFCQEKKLHPGRRTGTHSRNVINLKISHKLRVSTVMTNVHGSHTYFEEDCTPRVPDRERDTT
jgi:hypothetical protein